MAKRRKLSKRLRKGARRALGSDMVREVLEDLISAALIAAAVKLRDSAAGKRTAKAAKKKVGGLTVAAAQALAAEGSGKAKRKRKAG